MLRHCSKALARATRSSTRSFSSSRPALEVIGEADQAQFKKFVVDGKRTVLVDFHADWCPPCKMLDPILQKVMAEEAAGENEVDYMKINTDNENEVAAKYKISSLPTVVAFKHGKELSRFVGLVNEEAVKNFVANAKDH